MRYTPTKDASTAMILRTERISVEIPIEPNQSKMAKIRNVTANRYPKVFFMKYPAYMPMPQMITSRAIDTGVKMNARDIKIVGSGILII